MSEHDVEKMLKERDVLMSAEYEAALDLAAFDLREQVLDIATGSGRMLLGLVRRGYSVISGDIDATAQERARQRLGLLAGKPTLITMDAKSMDFEDDSFQAATLAHAVHEIDDPYTVLKEITRVLTADGRLLITEFNSQGFDLMELHHRLQGKPEHRRGEMSAEDISCYLHSAFETVEMCGFEITNAWIASTKKKGAGTQAGPK